MTARRKPCRAVRLDGHYTCEDKLGHSGYHHQEDPTTGKQVRWRRSQETGPVRQTTAPKRETDEQTPPALAEAHDPVRIQLRRTRGWRKPEGVIVVARPSRWGNPYRVDALRFAGEADPQRAAVDMFRHMFDRPDGRLYPTRLEVITELGGHDLACWCALDEPCHADVLLELANPTLPPYLSEQHRAILEFEQGRWSSPGAKEDAIRKTFGISATRYYQLLLMVIETPAAQFHYPQLVHRIRDRVTNATQARETRHPR